MGEGRSRGYVDVSSNGRSSWYVSVSSSGRSRGCVDCYHHQHEGEEESMGEGRSRGCVDVSGR